MDWRGILLSVVIVAAMWGYANSRGWRARRLWQQGMHAINGQDWPVAETSFRKCVRLVPIWTASRKMLAVALVKQNKLDEAEEQLRMASELEPRKPEGHLDLGFFLATQRPDRQEDAITAFARAVEHDPQVRDVLTMEKRLAFLRDNPRFAKLLAQGHADEQ
jgi:Tfp pilus assembly protein PilF